MALEDGKEYDITIKLNPSRPLPLRALQCCLMFLVLGVVVSLATMYTVQYFGVETMLPPSMSNIIFPCYEDMNDDLQSWIKPMPNLLHKMNDTELLWRASLVPKIKQYPFKRVPKIAFMFLTKGPLPLVPLWERFFHGQQSFYSIYIHALPGYVADFPPESVFYKRQIPGQVVEWGTMSMCDAERRLLANALLDISNEWFILVSESCIPLQNFSIIYRYISRSKYSFVSAFDDPSSVGRGRYNWNMQPEVTLEQWRKGSQWFEVDRRVAIKIVEDSIYYPKFRDFCQPSCYVDEHYVATMLTIQTPNLISNRTLTWTDWSRGGAHPATFGNGDISIELFRRIIDETTCDYNNQRTDFCFLFARKFAPSALEPLLELAIEVFRY